MKKDTFRVVTRGADGQLRIKDYGDKDALLKLHTQIGVDDCNTDLELRGMPVFRGLIGPMAEDKNVVRYETPDVFEALTKEWSAQPAEKKRRRRRSKPVADAAQAQAATKLGANKSADSGVAPAGSLEVDAPAQNTMQTIDAKQLSVDGNATAQPASESVPAPMMMKSDSPMEMPTETI